MNNIVPMPPVGTRDGNWIWNGQNWVCDPDCDDFPRPPHHFGPPVFSGPVNQPPWYPGANGGISFGSQPPPNPVRGHLFWNGTTLFLFDGAAWVSVGGASTGPVTPPGSTFPTNPAAGQQFFDGTTLWIWDGNAWVPVSQTKTFIQATQPPAPNAGDTWWNGSQFFVWDGSKWEMVGPGAVVGPVPTTTQVFSVVQSGYFTAPSGNFDIVTITATPQIDTLNGWDPPTKRYTPKKAGFYLFEVTVWEGSNGGIALVKNDQGTFVNDQNHPSLGIDSSNAAGYLQLFTTTTMNGTTDFVRLFGYSAGQFWGAPAPPLLSALLMP